MPSTLLFILTLATAATLAGFIAVSERRHRRLRRRVGRADRQILAARSELLTLLRGLYELAAARGEAPPAAGVGFRSQYGEDLLLFALLGGQREGFFIEAGANDGLRLSVTHAFESLGWTGLLVEPIPERADAAARNRPRSKVLHAALGRRGSSGVATLTVYEGGADGDNDLLSHLEDAPVKGDLRHGLAARTVRVPLTTLDEALAFHDGPVDLLVLDVEGAELDVLDGLDLARRRPRVLCIEDNDLYDGRAAPLGLEQHGYREITRIRANRIFIRTDDEPLNHRADLLALTPTTHR